GEVHEETQVLRRADGHGGRHPPALPRRLHPCPGHGGRRRSAGLLPFYLELRSRRLEKPPPPASKPRDPAKVTPKSNPSSRLCSQKAGRVPTSNSGSLRSARMRSGSENGEDAPPDLEVSFGENVLEPESRERETSPCGLTRDSGTMGTPGSSTRSTYTTAAKWRMQNPICQDIPTSHEIGEFFVGLEKLQQQIFIEKYNFDPVNDRPLPGRYEWEELDS
ncbi:unnamed protein product, partial [Musa textilis]